MKPTEAEKLLGGYATGTLTLEEQKILFAAALERQDSFDALADEEALRELLTDPAVTAQLIAALAPARPPKAIPFWRRPGLLGAAAGLVVATTAGLAYLRSPRQVPPTPQVLEAPKPPEAGAVTRLPVPQAPAAIDKRDTPAAPMNRAARPSPPPEEPAPPTPAPAAGEAPPTGIRAPVSAMAGAARMKVEAEADKTEAQDGLARSAPTWALAPQPGGNTLVTISAQRGSRIVLLRRNRTDTQVLKLQSVGIAGSLLGEWRAEVRLASGDVLDLYQLDSPATDPARLPETGPVEGYRIRIHPPAR